MAVQEPKKCLRIGVFRGKQKLEDRTLAKRHTVSIGRDDTNTFCILSSAVPKKWNLFIHNQNQDSYTLCLQKNNIRGRVLVKPGVDIKLDDSLQAGSNVQITSDKVYIPLTSQSRGQIIFGKITILFDFKYNRDEMAAARLMYEPPSVWEKIAELFPRAIAITLLFSLLVHLIPLLYIGLQDWPRDDETIVMPTWMKPVKIEEMQIEKEQEPIEEPTIIEDGQDVIADVPVDSEPSMDSGATRDQLMDQITDKHREQGALITAQILGVEGGIEGFYGDMLGSNTHIADMSDIAAGDIGASASGNLLNQLAAGDGSSGAGAGLLGIGSGTGTNGPQVVVDNAAKKNTTRAKVEFKMSDKSADFASAPPPGSKEAIEKMFQKKKGDITSCYQRVINAQGKASGRFVITILVAKDGKVMKVEVSEDQIGGEMFSCVRQRIMNWNFGELKTPIAFKKTWVFS